MKIIRHIILYISFFFLTACAGPTKNIETGQILESNQGIVITKIHSNWEGYDNPFLSDLDFSFYQIDGDKGRYWLRLSKADDLKVVALPAGEYKWSRIHFGSYYWEIIGDFAIRPNEITYIGDIHYHLDLGIFSVTGELRITDELEQIIGDVNAQFPHLLKKHNLTTELTTLQQK